MHWSSGGNFQLAKKFSCPPSIVISLLLLAATFCFIADNSLLSQIANNSGEKKITIYSSTANYSLPVTERNGLEYVGLLELLEPMGSVNAKASGQKWSLRFKDVKSEFTSGDTRARIQKNDVTLPASFILENGRGSVSLSSLTTLLPQMLGVPITFHDSARRLFIAGSEIHFTAAVNNSNTAPSALVFTFTLPVNPMIATEPGKLRMVFNHEPLLSSSPALTFADKTIHGATFRENNGAAEIEITSSAPLFAKFSNDGRTITVIPAPQATTQTSQIGSNPPASPIAAPGAATPKAGAEVKPVFAIIDASHGGDERGAALTDQVAEKDVTLAFARHVMQELESRGLSSRLLREADVTLTLEQRANRGNTANASVYICLHAASDGNGIRLYTALLPAPLPASGDPKKLFSDWDTAQSPFLQLSHIVETSIAAELSNRHILSRSLMAPLGPLNNITTAALAVEIGPGDAGVSDLSSSQYQQEMASYIASGVLAARAQLEAKR
ncbi:MAG: N-acetylmuramoyl-L-alanine amidase [Acidobacteriota bacterium]|nr:N-acetylmuramoyl-L-alanine amidase [Acidobacteriota bacterium]